MRTVKIKRTFRKQTDPALSILARGVFAKLQNNAAYPEASDIVTAAMPVLNDFDIATANALGTRDRNWVIAKAEARGTLMQTLIQLADLAQYKTPGNELLLASTGFDLTAQTNASAVLAKPNYLNVELLQGEGSVRLKALTNKNCKLYLFEYIQLPNPENNWSSNIGSSSRVTISGLTPGSQYSFRCAYLGSKGQGPWSDVITRFVA